MSPRILAVTGTGTGVGKTHVSAALCSLADELDRRAAYLKVAQTGVPGDTPDIDVVSSRAGVQVVEGARYKAAMSPEAAARAERRSGPDRGHVAALARVLAGENDVLVIEGAGGLLVRMAADGWTLADLCADLAASVVLVCGPELGTLNATALTLEALDRRGLTVAALVLNNRGDGALADSNEQDLRTLAAPRPLLVVPAGDDARDALRMLLSG